jgi:prephenate dehydratase
VKVAVLGAPGSFSRRAARRLAGCEATLVGMPTFDDVFAAVSRGTAHRGVVPLRNTLAGDVAANAARVDDAAWRVTGRLRLAVRQCLIVRPGTRLRDVQRVASHPAALLQCTRLIAAVPGCVTLHLADTATGVRDLMAGALQADAVIASVEAARRYGAEILAAGVQDAARNYTEFAMFARARGHRRPCGDTGSARVSAPA